MGPNQGKLNRLFKRRPPSEADRQRGTRQLRRIESLVDCVFALIIVLTVLELPLPADEGLTDVSVIEFLQSHVDAYMPSLIAIILVVIYWTQHNLLFGNLLRTDDRHAVVSVLQIFFLLLYFYTIGLGLDLGNPPAALALQSAAVVLIGLCSLAGWTYASRSRRLLAPEVTADEIRTVSIRMLAEPITALITLICAAFGKIAWEVAWLSYPFVAWLLKQRSGSMPE